MQKLMIALALIAAPAGAQIPKSDMDKIEDKAEGVLRQPLKDIGIMKEEAPEILLAASQAPYSLTGLRNCRDYSRAIATLTEILGPDVDTVNAKGEPLTGRLAEAGAKTVVNAFIPFRGLVREATGAAEDERRLRNVLLAGGARRAYLKGYATAKGCRA